MLTHEVKVYKTWDYFNEGIMKMFLSLICFPYLLSYDCRTCFAQAQVKGQSIPNPSVKKEQQAGSKSSKRETQRIATGVKTKQKVDFAGTVTNVDSETATLSLRSQGKTISFDMSKVILMGYGSTREIKKGDEVSVGYTQFGLQIRKGVFAITQRESVPHRKAAPQQPVTRAETAKSQRDTPIRMKDNKNPTSFKDVDNNKDGKITPIELCVLLPDLTLQKFKEYDKNGDGCLNEQEFSTVKRTR